MLQSDFEFDAVLMDIQWVHCHCQQFTSECPCRMPLLNGFEATERIRGFEQTRESNSHRASHKINGRIPIFAVSASLFEDQQEELLKLGFDGWILKPIDLIALSEAL